MPNPLVPNKSDAYRAGESIFFIQFNDFDIYVEDEDSEEFYLVVLRRLFSAVRIERIFPLNGKSNVVAHAVAHVSDLRAVHLVDKDFDDLLSKKIALPNLFYLKKYNIECYLLEPNAIVNLIVSEVPRKKRAEVKVTFNVVTFIQQAIGSIRSLFLHYFIAQKCGLGVANTGQHVAHFTEKGKRGNVNIAKVNQYIAEIEKLMEEKGMDISKEREMYLTAFELHKANELEGANICGKYLIGLLIGSLSEMFGIRGLTLESATYRLAQYAELDSLWFLRKDVQVFLERT